MASSAPLDRQPIVVIGIGNTLRRDDGVGPAVVEFLDRTRRLASGVVTRTVHQLAPEMAEQISGAARVVFVDASTLLPPGVVSTACIAPAAHVDLGAHALTPSMLLAVSASVFGRAPDAIVVAVGVADVETGDTLSPAVQAAVAEAAEAVLAVIQTSG
jgi:hydrogenase maturation protease